MIILNEFNVFDGQIKIRNLSGNFDLSNVSNFYSGIPANSLAVSGSLQTDNSNLISWDLYNTKDNLSIQNNTSFIKSYFIRF